MNTRLKWQLLTTTSLPRTPEGDGAPAGGAPAGGAAGGDGAPAAGAAPAGADAGTLAGGAPDATGAPAGADQSGTPGATDKPAEAPKEAAPAPDLSKSLAGGDDEIEDPPADGDKPADPPADAPTTDLAGEALPEKYELKAPDGFVVDDQLNGVAQKAFKDARLNPAQAQAVADAYAEIKKTETKRWTDTVLDWRNQTQKDPNLVEGGFKQNMGYVRKAVAEFGDDELRKVFNDYGLGNHPAINRMLMKVGKATGERPPAPSGGGNTGQEESHAQILYGPKA